MSLRHTHTHAFMHTLALCTKAHARAHTHVHSTHDNVLEGRSPTLPFTGKQREVSQGTAGNDRITDLIEQLGAEVFEQVPVPKTCLRASEFVTLHASEMHVCCSVDSAFRGGHRPSATK